MRLSNRPRVVCYFDGACPGNQFDKKGPMRAAYVIDDREFVLDVPDLETPEGPLRTNNIAEYHGLIFLLRHLDKLEVKDRIRRAYQIFGDSQLVIRQMNGRYRVTKPHLATLHAQAKRLAEALDVRFQEVPREKNRAGFLLE